MGEGESDGNECSGVCKEIEFPVQAKGVAFAESNLRFRTAGQSSGKWQKETKDCDQWGRKEDDEIE